MVELDEIIRDFSRKLNMEPPVKLGLDGSGQTD